MTSQTGKKYMKDNYVISINDMDKLGFKLITDCKGISYYTKFGQTNISLTIDNDGRWCIDPTYLHTKERINNQMIHLTSKHYSANNYELFVMLINWLENISNNEPSEGIKSQCVKVDYTKTYIPTISSTKDRIMKIYVWGRNRRKFPSYLGLDHNFNACRLFDRKKGVDWRKDARNEDVRMGVMKGKGFSQFMYDIVYTIETNDLHNIGINCSKGRHRSVTCAISLSTYFYPNAEIIYMEL